jgi:hypothetical protein
MIDQGIVAIGQGIVVVITLVSIFMRYREYKSGRIEKKRFITFLVLSVILVIIATGVIFLQLSPIPRE